MSLSDEEIDKLLRWAINENIARIYDILDQEPEGPDRTLSSLTKLKGKYAREKLATETIPSYDIEASPDDFEEDLLGILQQLTFEYQGYESSLGPVYPVNESIQEDGLSSTYRAKISQLMTAIGQGDPIETRFLFPLNIVWETETPEFEVFDILFSPLSAEEWQREFDEFVDEPDVFGTPRIQSMLEQSEFTFWEVRMETKGPRYAAAKLRKAINILCAEINIAEYLWSVELQNPRESATSAKPRWSWITHPFAMLTRQAGRPVETSLLNDTPRQTVRLNWSGTEVASRFARFPSFEYGQKGIRGSLQDALVEYQEAIEEDDRRHSFLAFWRVIEGLTLAGLGEKTEIEKRALWALKMALDEEPGQFIVTITEELYDTRNKWVHEPNWSEISIIHEKIAKLLADGLIWLHINEIPGVDESIVSEVFNHAKLLGHQRDNEYQEAQRTIKGIEILRHIENS